MANFEMAFEFEQSAVPLGDGTFFQPLRDAIERWGSRSESPYAAAPGSTFRLLYRIAESEFVMVEYGLCAPFKLRDGGVIWRAPSPPRAGRIQPVQALAFLLRHQFPIPDNLQSLLSQAAKKRECRPLEYWSTQPILDTELPKVAQDVDLLDQAKLIHHVLTRFVQEIRAWDLRGRGCPSADTVATYLFGTYQVDPNEWWGEQGVIPPARAAVDELPWPQVWASIQSCLVRVKTLLLVPLSASQATWYFGTPWFPTAEEQDAAAHAVKGALLELEPLVVVLGKSLVAAEAAEVSVGGTPSDIAEPTPAEKPKRGAGRADWKALDSYERALQLMQIVAADIGDQEVYDWIREHGLDGDLEGYELPQFDSWRRYRNRAREAREAGEISSVNPTSPRSAVRREEL